MVYDDSDHGFMGEGFPYFELANRLAVNLDERGIEFQHHKSVADTEVPTSLIGDKNVGI